MAGPDVLTGGSFGPEAGIVAILVCAVPGGVRIEVHDSVDRDEGEPTVRTASSDAERGRGPALVDTLTAHQWGVTDRDGPGKVVWAICTDPEACPPVPPA